MKKLILVFLAVIFISVSVSGQEEFFQRAIDECINLLGKPVPATGFQRMNQNGYLRGEDNTALITENNLIVFSSFGYYNQTTERVEAFNSVVRNILKKTNWVYYNTFKGGYEVYQKNGVYCGILKPSRRDDGSFATVIGFSKDLRNFNF